MDEQRIVSRRADRVEAEVNELLKSGYSISPGGIMLEQRENDNDADPPWCVVVLHKPNGTE